jgi:hypothetical protein
MPKRFILFFYLSMISVAISAQSKLGEMACVYVTTSNLDSSIAVYEKLGFPKIASNTFPLPWAQCSDGSLLIMMRQDSRPFMGLAYYVNDIDKTVQQLEKDGIIFDQRPKEGDVVKRFFIKSPDGFNIMLVPNIGGFQQPTGISLLNMNPADLDKAEKYPNKQCGAFGEFCHPVTSIEASIAFWKKLGFTVKADMKQPYPHAILSDGLMIIGLHQTRHFDHPAITYFGMNTAARVEELKQKGLKNFTELMGKNNIDLKTWEGQHFFIFSLGM